MFSNVRHSHFGPGYGGDSWAEYELRKGAAGMDAFAPRPQGPRALSTAEYVAYSMIDYEHPDCESFDDCFDRGRRHMHAAADTRALPSERRPRSITSTRGATLFGNQGGLDGLTTGHRQTPKGVAGGPARAATGGAPPLVYRMPTHGTARGIASQKLVFDPTTRRWHRV